jgi:uncharacterized C2H2 Zn-finger protein
MSTKTLAFNSVSTDELNFPKCPTCQALFNISSQFTQAKTLLSNKQRNFNSKINFQCPSCNHIIELFVAFRLNNNGSISLCVQRSDAEGANGIPVNWYQR